MIGVHNLLDNPKVYQRLDHSGMLKHLHQFPTECQQAWERGVDFGLSLRYSQVNKAIVLGMGGSAIGGQLLRRLAILEGEIPVWVHQDYDLPPFVDEHTLIIASSYSGNTEETISSFTESLKTPAKKIAITAGGKLRDQAEQAGIPVLLINYQAPPRSAFPHSFFSLVGIFHELGLLCIKPADLMEAIEILNNLSAELRETSPSISNPAKQLATSLLGRLPVIYGAGILSEVAQRWKTQLNENSKTGAFCDVFPELGHNAVVGYEYPHESRERILTIFLHSFLLHPRISQRYAATTALLDRLGINYAMVEAGGKTPLAQMMSLVLFGDYVSLYLAMLNGVDPTPTEPIEYLKNHLS